MNRGLFIKIGIMAIGDGENHYEYVLTLFNVLKRENTQIILFLGQNIYKEVKKDKSISSNITLLVKDIEESTYDFLKKNRSILNQLDFFVSDEIYVSPRHDWKLPFILKLKCPKILTLHNVNIWLKPKASLNIRYCARMFLRMYLLRKFDGVTVFSNNIKNYVLQDTNYKKAVFVTPFSYYSNDNNFDDKKNVNSIINITIPGTIKKARRDYDKILSIYDSIIENKVPIKLVLLGKPIGEYGKKILKVCEDINSRGGNIEYFGDYIPRDVFENKIKEASILYADIPPKYYIDGTEEIYGLTKETGVTFLMIKYTKPAILPILFKNMPELDKSIIRYENLVDLEKILINLDNITIKKLTEQALINSEKFTIEKIRKGTIDNLYFVT